MINLTTLTEFFNSRTEFDVFQDNFIQFDFGSDLSLGFEFSEDGDRFLVSAETYLDPADYEETYNLKIERVYLEDGHGDRITVMLSLAELDQLEKNLDGYVYETLKAEFLINI